MIEWLRDLTKEVRFALRGLAKAPALSLVAVTAIAVGIGANTIVYSILHGTVLDPLPAGDLDRVMLLDARTGEQQRRFGDANFVDATRQLESFEVVAAARSNGLRITESDVPLMPLMREVSAGWFDTFRVTPLLGRTFDAAEDVPGGPKVAVLAHEFWIDYYGGDREVVGRSIELLGEPWEIIGVLPPGHRDPTFIGQPVLYMPLRLAPETALREEPDSGAFLRVFGRRARGVSEHRAEAEIERFAGDLRALYPEANRDLVLRARDAKDTLVGDQASMLLLLMAAVASVLLIACANVANLLLARSIVRRREISVRLALGASAGRLIRQLTVEGLVLASFGGAAGVALAFLGLGPVLHWFPNQGPAAALAIETVSIDGAVLLVSFALTVLAGLIFGLVPALRALLGRTDGLGAGAVRAIGTGGTKRGRQILVAAEVAVCLSLLVGAGLTVQSFARLSRLSTGLDPENVLSFRTGARGDMMADADGWRRFHDRVLDELRATPGFEQVGSANFMPMSFPWAGRDVVIDGVASDVEGAGPLALGQGASPGFFETLGMPLLAGRSFTDADRDGAEPVVVINQAMADAFWPQGNALGGTVGIARIDATRRRVIGIVGSLRDVGDDPTPKPVVWVPSGQITPISRNYYVRTRMSQAQAEIAYRTAVWKVHPDAPVYGETTMNEVVDQRDWQSRFVMRMLAGFAALALLLAASGIYGVLSFLVTEQRREIGVRMAIGADRLQVLRLVITRALGPASAGVLAGLFGGIAVARALASRLYDIQPFDPLTFAAVAVTMLLVATLAALVPALRATRIEPVRVLNEE